MSAFPPANHSHRESCVQRPVPISRSSRRNSPLTALSPPYNSWCFRKCSPRLFPTTLCSRTTSARSIAASVSRTASLALAPADPTTPLLLPSQVGICSPVVICPEQVVIYSQAVLSTEQTRRPSTVSRRPSGSTHVWPRMCSQHTASLPSSTAQRFWHARLRSGPSQSGRRPCVRAWQLSREGSATPITCKVSALPAPAKSASAS